jgi:hypothetical protein
LSPFLPEPEKNPATPKTAVVLGWDDETAADTDSSSSGSRTASIRCRPRAAETAQLLRRIEDLILRWPGLGRRTGAY